MNIKPVEAILGMCAMRRRHGLVVCAAPDLGWMKAHVSIAKVLLLYLHRISI